MKGLKDIKPLVDVPDSSMYVLILIIISLSVFIGLILWWIKRPKRRRKRKLSPQELAKIELESIDFNNTKNAVYTFSEFMRFLVDNETQQEFEKLINKLELYKYKKEIPSLSLEDKEAMKKMIKEVS
jgi:hypothetical protein